MDITCDLKAVRAHNVPPLTAMTMFHSAVATPSGGRYAGGAHRMEVGWVISFLTQLRPRQNGRHFADDTLKCLFFNGNVSILIKISMKFVPKGPFNNIPALDQIMAWRLPGDKPISEPMMVRLPMHICVTRPQWVLRRYEFVITFGHGNTLCKTRPIVSGINWSPVWISLTKDQ